eukprot:scaffold56414_cov50-Cyclotella_meneghiniana.AAC.1
MASVSTGIGERWQRFRRTNTIQHQNLCLCLLGIHFCQRYCKQTILHEREFHEGVLEQSRQFRVSVGCERGSCVLIPSKREETRACDMEAWQAPRCRMSSHGGGGLASMDLAACGVMYVV